MNITQNPIFCNPAKTSFNSILGNSYFVPHIWHHKIVRGGNKPDNAGITILSELLQLYLTSAEGEREFQLGYNYFKSKFNYTYEQLYEALLRLEQQDLISKRGKCIIFNVENVLALSIEQKDNDGKDSNNISQDIDSSIDKNAKENSLNRYLYIDNFIKRDIEVKREENYISGSSFNKNSPKPKTNQVKTLKLGAKPEGIIKTAKKWVKNLKPKPISSFHPLTEEDAETLRLRSGREFNLNFINQLTLRLAAKYPEHKFYKKELFMKYLALALAGEMRQAVNVNNEGFRFKRNDEEGAAEEYLSRVEDGYGNKASDQIRRKVAASFEHTVAYKILTSCYFPEELVDGKYEIRQRLLLKLSKHQQDHLYSQVSAVFGDSVRSIEITKNFKPVAKPQHISTFKEAQASTCALDITTLWGRIRDSLIKHYGEAIDKSWFSRLEPTEDASSRSLILKGASFLTDYIQTNYSHMIERLCQEEDYQLKFC